MSIQTIDEFSKLTGQRVWFLRHIVGKRWDERLGETPVESNRPIVFEWLVGPLLKFRSPYLRSRAGFEVNTNAFEVATPVNWDSGPHIYNVDFGDARRCKREARTISVGWYLPALHTRLNRRYGRSAVFSSQDAAETARVYIALSGEAMEIGEAEQDPRYLGINIETMPPDLYSKTGRWAIPSISPVGV